MLIWTGNIDQDGRCVEVELLHSSHDLQADHYHTEKRAAALNLGVEWLPYPPSSRKSVSTLRELHVVGVVGPFFPVVRR